MAGPRRARKRLSVTQFPPDLGISSEHAHYMMFSTFDINGSIGSSASDTTFSTTGESVALPIPASPSAQYDQGWEAETKGFGKSALTGIVDAARQASTQDEGGRGGAPTTSFRDRFSASVKNQYKDELGNLDVGDVGELIVGGFTAGRIGQQATGKALFDESFAVYGGPAYRTFAFSFSMMPLSQKDTETIKGIVDFFKINSAPTSLAAGVVRIYELPKAFGITFHNRGKENEYLNKIGKCALTSMNVSYGGEKFNVFDQTDAPVQVDISLSFTELQLQDSASYKAGF
jgi:hypothetical protein